MEVVAPAETAEMEEVAVRVAAEVPAVAVAPVGLAAVGVVDQEVRVGPATPSHLRSRYKAIPVALPSISGPSRSLFPNSELNISRIFESPLSGSLS